MFFIFWFIFNLGQLSYISQWKGAGLWSKLAFWGKRLDSPAWQSWLESELLALGEMSVWLQTWDMESANNRLPKIPLASMLSLQHFMSQWQRRSQIGHRFQIIFSPPQSIGKVSSSKWFFKSMVQIHLIKVIEWLLAWAHCHWICSNKRHKPNPSRFVRRGRAAKADDPDFDLASDVEDSELASWLEKPGRSMAWQVLQSTNHKKLTKFLPPGNLMELYQHYAATRQLLAAKVLSSTPKLFLKQKHRFKIL